MKQSFVSALRQGAARCIRAAVWLDLLREGWQQTEASAVSRWAGLGIGS